MPACTADVSSASVNVTVNGPPGVARLISRHFSLKDSSAFSETSTAGAWGAAAPFRESPAALQASVLRASASSARAIADLCLDNCIGFPRDFMLWRGIIAPDGVLAT